MSGGSGFTLKANAQQRAAIAELYRQNGWSLPTNDLTSQEGDSDEDEGDYLDMSQGFTLTREDRKQGLSTYTRRQKELKTAADEYLALKSVQKPHPENKLAAPPILPEQYNSRDLRTTAKRNQTGAPSKSVAGRDTLMRAKQVTRNKDEIEFTSYCVATDDTVSDVFTLEDLAAICGRYGVVTVLPNEAYSFMVQGWRDKLNTKYGPLKGIQKMHDLRAFQEQGRARVFQEVKDRCDAGDWKDSPQEVKLVAELSSEHVQSVPKTNVRIVLVVDRSGSMLHKIGKAKRHPKITMVKRFARQLVRSMDEGDEAAIVTFGAGADILLPLVKVKNQSRSVLLSEIDKLDKGCMESKTDLGAGLKKALEVFDEVTDRHDDLLTSKNSILVFSDGDINAGTTEPNRLVHEIRQRIREMVPSLDDSTNQWVSISVINTGSSVSETMYLLSKTCSSDAYYYVDKDSADLESDFFLPVMLRKSAVVWNVSVLIEVCNGSFVDDKCTQDFKIRLRRSTARHKELGTKVEKAFFLYDFPAGKTRQFGVTADFASTKHLDEFEDDETVFKIRVEYTNKNGDRKQIHRTVSAKDLNSSENADDCSLSAVCKHDVKLVSHDALSKAADYVKDGNVRESRAVLQEGKSKVQKLCEAYGERARAERQETNKYDIASYAASVCENLENLVQGMLGAYTSEGSTWNKMKALSTAITRETPSVSDVKQGAILCPVPSVNHIESEGMKDPLEKMMARQGKNKRVTCGNLDALLEDLERTSVKSPYS